MTDSKINILMTGAGAPGGPGIIQCLQRSSLLHLTTADANASATGRFLSDDFIQIPKATAPDFIDKVLEICLNRNIKVVFPLVTLELFRFAKEKERFDRAGIKIIVSDWESLEVANNKSRLCLHLSERGILTPEFEVVASGDCDQLIAAFKRLGFPGRPLCIKPSISNGSRGVRIVDPQKDKYDLLFLEKPNSLYMNYEELLDILNGKPFPELLVSEVLPGEEYTIDTIVNQGVVEIILPRRRIKMSGGISVEGEFVNHEPIMEYCRQILGSLALNGPIGIQVKAATDGSFKILEINPRIQGTSVSAMGMGVNLPLMAVYNELGMPFDIPPLQWGKKFARYFQEVYF
jgi:carbamoyl-phosphate synthase large subunit